MSKKIKLKRYATDDSLSLESMILDARNEPDPEIKSRKIVAIWRTHYRLAVIIYRAFAGKDYVDMHFEDAQSYLWQGITKCVKMWDKEKGGSAVTYTVNCAKFYVLNACRRQREALSAFNYELEMIPLPEYDESLHAMLMERCEEYNNDEDE